MGIVIGLLEKIVFSGYFWVVFAILYVGYQLDRRLEMIWNVVYELPSRLNRHSELERIEEDSKVKLVARD
ncbi:MAG: hypothetical protein ABSD20_03115 [Terriglobales bacterium]